MNKSFLAGRSLSASHLGSKNERVWGQPDKQLGKRSPWEHMLPFEGYMKSISEFRSGTTTRRSVLKAGKRVVRAEDISRAILERLRIWLTHASSCISWWNIPSVSRIVRRLVPSPFSSSSLVRLSHGLHCVCHLATCSPGYCLRNRVKADQERSSRP